MEENSSLFIDVNNDDIDDELGPNIVFSNIAAGDTVSVSWNWWGQMPGSRPPDETIWDQKDQPSNKGLADTGGDYSPTTQIYSRNWRD